LAKNSALDAPLIVPSSRAGAVARAVVALRAGGVVAFPTETVYGLGVRAGDGPARRRLAALKGRDRSKPFQLLLADARQALRIAPDMPESARRLAEAFWPGPLTLVVRDARGRWQGLRVPDHRVPRVIARGLGGALLATSANRSGEAPAARAKEIARVFGGKLGVIIDGGAAGSGRPSSVVKVWQRKWELLREGAISRERIARAISKRA
jgi:L-threonylcarbamoyladenylate synthase